MLESKDKELSSNTVTFTVTDPSVLNSYTEITIPVVFHLIQSNNDITEYGERFPWKGPIFYLIK